MDNNIENGKKKVSLSIDADMNSPAYRYFLIQPVSEEMLQIDFAETEETEDEIHLMVKESIKLSSDVAIRFAFDFIHALEEYEEKYHNGKGIRGQQEVE